MLLNYTVCITRRSCKLLLSYPQGVHRTMHTHMMKLMHVMYLRVHGYTLLYRGNNPKG